MTEAHTHGADGLCGAGRRHGVEDLCPAGTDLYERALREGSVRRADADVAPCLVDHGLLHPAVEDPGRLEPVAPAVALHRLLRTSPPRCTPTRSSSPPSTASPPANEP